MDSNQEVATAQAAAWNGAAGRAWVDSQGLLDQIFGPVQQRLIETLSAAGATRVLDVGCGAGATTLAAAATLKGSQCTGVDISEPLVALARSRAAHKGLPTRFVVADAQRHSFPSGHFDAIISRFGIMFFDDPSAAFRNLYEASADNAMLCCFAWRSVEDNPFMTAAERAARPVMPQLPVRQPGAPGQFAFADRKRVQRVLHDAGWRQIGIRAVDVPCSFPTAALEDYFTRLGPVGQQLPTLDVATRTAVVARVGRAFEPFVDGDSVRFMAALWRISARR